jgi:hypothetical protein
MSSREFITKVRKFLGLKGAPTVSSSVPRPPTRACLQVNQLEDRVVPAVVTVSVATADAVWNGPNGAVTFNRTGSLFAPLTVHYSVGGLAVAGTDYTPLSGTATFAPGSATTTVPVVALSTGTTGSDVLLTLTNGSGYTAGPQVSGDVTVICVPDTVTAFGGSATTPTSTAITVPVLNLSSDTMGITLSVTGVTQGANGSVVINANGTVTYTPNSGFSGPDTFNYTVKDRFGNQSTGTVSVTVTTPIAESATIWTAANTPVNVPVGSLAAETGNTLTVTGVTQGANGSVVINADGTVTYTPNSGFSGRDTFSYTVTDPQGNKVTGTVTVDVGTSDPVALGTAVATAPNTAINVAVLNFAADLSGAALGVSGVTQGANGSVVLNADGTVTYTPNSGFSGTDAFTYSVTDGQGNTATATVSVSVGPAPAVALTAGASTTPATPVTIAVADFASASPGDTLTVTGVTQGANGSVVLNPDGTVTYTPNSGFTGIDTFTYTVTDKFGAQSTGTVSVSVDGTAPVEAQSTTAWTGANTPLNVTVLNLATDASGTALTVSGVTQGAHGSVTLNADGTVTYTPSSGFCGNDTFTYTVTDGQDTATGTITVTIGPTAPIVVGTSVTTAVGTSVNIAVLSLASDPNGDALSVSSVTQGANGSVVINPNGTVTYTPNSGFVGTDTFTYTITDPNGHQTVATATVTVGSTTPTALSTDASTATGTAVNVAVANFAYDSSGSTPTVTGVTQGANGSVVINANGTVTYTPNSGFTGTDAFTYTVTNGVNSATGTITVTVGGAALQAVNVQQTENTLAALAGALSAPNTVSGALSALSAAAIAGTNSLLNGTSYVGTGQSGLLATQQAAYSQALSTYNQLRSQEAQLWAAMRINKRVIEYLVGQLAAAELAVPKNAALIKSLNAKLTFLIELQTKLAKAWIAVRDKLNMLLPNLDNDFWTLQLMAEPVPGGIVKMPPAPLPPPKRDTADVFPKIAAFTVELAQSQQD